MEKFELYISDINKCLQSIINIFKLQEIELNFNLLDKVNELDTNNLEDFVTPIPPPIIVYKNQSFGDLPNPVRRYYDFKGWFLHFEKDENYIPARLVWDNEILDYSKVLLSGNKVTLYAKWELKTIDIKLDACGGTVEPETIKCKLFDNLYNVIYNPIYPVKGPIKANNTFTGWIDNTGQKISEPTLLTPGIDRLFAQYNLKFCKLLFNYNYKYNYQDIDASIIKGENSFLSNFTEISGIESGTTINLVSYDPTPEDALDGKPINLIEDANISAKGKTFRGWSLLKNNPDTQFTVYIYDDTTLYSSWDPYEYKIIYKYSEESTTPLSVQTVKYNEVASLIPYKTLFYTNPPEDFTWGHSQTDHFIENEPVFIDNDMVENLKSSGNGDIDFYPKEDLVEKFDSNAIILKNGGKSLKKYALNEPFYGLNFEISFSNNEKRHPTEIRPSVFTSDVTDVTCFFGELSVKVSVQQNNSNGLSSVFLDLREIQNEYRYGEFLNLENLIAVETYENGSSKRVKYSEFPENFFTFPSVESFLTSDCTIYFGYKSITDETIWPHVEGNKAMWDNTASSISVQVERGEKAIILTDLPEKTTYIENNTLDLSGLTLFIEMMTNDIIPASLSNFNFKINPRSNDRLYEYNDNILLNTTDSSVTVQLKENSTISTEFPIKVLQKQITSIELLSGSSTQTIFNSNISEIEEIVNAIILNTNNEDANLSLIVKYDNNTTSVEKINSNMTATGMISFDTYPSEDQLGQIYGEISFYIYYTPTNYNLNRETFPADFLVKKRFPYTICEFNIDNEHASINNNQLEINHIRSFSRNPLALECFALDDSTIVSEIIFSAFKEKINNETINDYIFSTSINLKKFTKFRITSLENNSSDIYFDKDEMEIYPTKSFINNYINSISCVVPTYCFYNSRIANVSIENDLSIIYDYGFENDPELTSLVFSEKLKSIGDFAFANCPLLSSFTFNGKCPDFNPKNSFGQNAGDFTGNDVSKREIRYLSTFSSDFIGEESKIYNTLSQKARPTYPFDFKILE